MKRYLRWSYAFLSIFIAITFFVLNHPGLKEGTFSETRENVPEVIVTNVSLIRFNEVGQPKETLKTPRLYRMPNESFFYLEKPTISIQQENADIWYIQADQAQVPEQKGLVTFEKNVLVYSMGGPKKAPSYLKTEKLFYDSKTQFAMTPLFVSFEQPGSIISGIGMKAWLLEKKVELLHDTKMTYEPKQQG